MHWRSLNLSASFEWVFGFDGGQAHQVTSKLEAFDYLVSPICKDLQQCAHPRTSNCRWFRGNKSLRHKLTTKRDAESAVMN